MALLPEKHSDRIAWVQNRIALWTANATAIGTTTGQVTAADTAATAAAAALAAQGVAQDAAKAATETLDDAMAALTNATMIVVEQVRTKARSAGSAVYPLANIPAPATPSPKPPPGQPTELKVSLTQTGALDMKWKCPQPPNASGTIYNVFRYSGGGVPTDADYLYIGGSGVREFTDETAPAGVPLIMYKIQAVRSTSVGPWATFNVFMGVNEGGSAFIESVQNTSQKLAA
jgi:hypothetical protein